MALGTPVDETYKTGTTSLGTSSSFSAASGDLIFVEVVSGSASGLPTAQTISDSQGLTWTSLVNATQSGTRHVRLQVWCAVSNGNAMTVTITAGATPPQLCVLQVVSITGSVQSVSNTGSDADGNGDPAPSLTSAPGSLSTVLGLWGGYGTNAISPPSGFTELQEVGIDSGGGGGSDGFVRLETVYDAGSASQSASWSSTGSDCVGALLEVRPRLPRSFSSVVG